MSRRYPLDPLLDAAGMTLSAFRLHQPMSGPTYRIARDQGLTADQADRWANKVGLHPMNVWPDWGTEALRSCDRCGTEYVPVRVKQRWCSKTCRLYNAQAEYQRRRWANDPAWAEQQRERVRAYRAATADYQRAEARRRRQRSRQRSQERVA